jgi:radical SAM protein with 4Fe4S-binding SPASM domain
VYAAYIKYLTPFKLHNYFKSWRRHFSESRKHQIKTPPLPWALSVEPANFCNLNCLECKVGNENLNRKKGIIEIPLFTSIIKQTHKHLIHLNLYFQGESLLHPNIPQIIEIAKNHKIYTCISTNGILLKDTFKELADSGLELLIVSVDGLSEETYQTYRKNGQLKTVIDGIKLLSQYKKENKLIFPHIQIQCIAMKHNEHELPLLKNLKKQTGANSIRIKSVQISDIKNKNLLPQNPKYSRYFLKNNQLEIKNRLQNKCYRMWSSCVITYNGIVVPCCFDKDATFNLGNLNNETFKSIWSNKAYSDFRQEIFTNRSSIAMCKNCTEGIQIKY